MNIDGSDEPKYKSFTAYTLFVIFANVKVRGIASW